MVSTSIISFSHNIDMAKSTSDPIVFYLLMSGLGALATVPFCGPYGVAGWLVAAVCLLDLNSSYHKYRSGFPGRRTGSIRRGGRRNLA